MKRVVDPKTVTWVLNERDRACLYGIYSGDPCSGPLSVHHIDKRSQLGDDVPENLITLCLKHHEAAERRLVKPEQFLEALLFFYPEYEERDHAKETKF
jgi:hypothetical protein